VRRSSPRAQGGAHTRQKERLLLTANEGGGREGRHSLVFRGGATVAAGVKIGERSGEVLHMNGGFRVAPQHSKVEERSLA
jgi:hypothetical protein